MMEKSMPNWKGPNKKMKNTKTKIVLKIFINNQANTDNNGEQHKKCLSWIGEPICKEKDHNKDTVDMEKTKKETGSRRIQKNKGRRTWKKNEKEKIRQTICRSVVSR